MAESDITQMQLSERLGVAQTTISKRVRGSVRWTIDDVVQVAAALDVPLERVLPLDELGLAS